MDWGLAGAVTLTGLLVVFLVLVILIVLCTLLGKILNIGKKSGSSNQPKEKKKAAKANEAPAPASAPAAAPIQNEEDEGVLAAIFAAVAYMMGGKPFALKSIRRSDKKSRNIWNAAGIAENTRPF